MANTPSLNASMRVVPSVNAGSVRRLESAVSTSSRARSWRAPSLFLSVGDWQLDFFASIARHLSCDAGAFPFADGHQGEHPGSKRKQQGRAVSPFGRGRIKFDHVEEFPLYE